MRFYYRIASFLLSFFGDFGAFPYLARGARSDVPDDFIGEFSGVLRRREVEIHEQRFLYPVEEQERECSDRKQDRNASGVGQAHREDDGDFGVSHGRLVAWSEVFDKEIDEFRGGFFGWDLSLDGTQSCRLIFKRRKHAGPLPFITPLKNIV